ncbi:hypothetical protein J2T60_001747 [Natronospira proteinivora]|uniref:Secreted protein n=1 Tax=Natronospira proteinivora TaxID=1807133 RepID=A0ABT1GCS7_9GAMM|nr:hypothetical protein [Natronospira proteinivora]MCP1727747.1 hypothetical protein [Natronospira proteinivora]
MKRPKIPLLASVLLLTPGGVLWAAEETPDPALLEFIGEFSEADNDQWIDPTLLPALEDSGIEADDDGQENDDENA